MKTLDWNSERTVREAMRILVNLYLRYNHKIWNLTKKFHDFLFSSKSTRNKQFRMKIENAFSSEWIFYHAEYRMILRCFFFFFFFFEGTPHTQLSRSERGSTTLDTKITHSLFALKNI